MGCDEIIKSVCLKERTAGYSRCSDFAWGGGILCGLFFALLCWCVNMFELIGEMVEREDDASDAASEEDSDKLGESGEDMGTEPEPV